MSTNCLDIVMTYSQLAIAGVWSHVSEAWLDERGGFREVYKLSDTSAYLDRPFQVSQVNQSTSGKGVIRGIHLTLGREGQEKYVFCSEGSIWDVAVDLRPSSSTYGKWCSQLLSATNGTSLMIPKGVGHAFLALEANTVVTYLCSTEYAPQNEIVVNPLDTAIGIPFQEIADDYTIYNFTLSDKDSHGMSLSEFSKVSLDSRSEI
jgi:dTDP-4-dehydrorhamnose 3,5-epimerase